MANAMLARFPECELWYYRWDRYEAAFEPIYYDRPRMRRRVEALHEATAERSTLTFTISEKLMDLEHHAGREAVVVPVTADSFPAPDPHAGVIAVSLGFLGWRTDWRLLREIATRMPELTVLLIGAWDERCGDDPDFQACRRMPGLIWLGRRTDEDASRLIGCADVGILPFKRDAYNDAGLPVRILKFARLGRRTITPELAGAHTFEPAILPVADGPDQWVDALRDQAGTRSHPDLELRRWALSQSAEAAHAPLWERLASLGIPRLRRE